MYFLNLLLNYISYADVSNIYLKNFEQVVKNISLKLKKIIIKIVIFFKNVSNVTFVLMYLLVLREIRLCMSLILVEQIA